MEIEQKETDCKCKNSTGWTTIKCCNQCGKSVESFWRVLQPKEDMVEYQRIVELTAVGMGKQQEIDQAQLTIKNLQTRINELERFLGWSEIEPHHPIGTRLGYGNIPLEPNWEEIAKIEPPLDNSTTNKAWRGAWLEGQMAGYAKCMTTVVDKLQKEVIQPLRESFEFERKICQKWFERCKKRADEITKLEAEIDKLREMMSVEHCPSLSDCHSASQQLDKMRAENKALRGLSNLMAEYIEFLREAIKTPESIAYVHGWRCPEETAKKGTELRAKIDQLLKNEG